MARKEDTLRPFRIVGTGEGEIPPHWPQAPTWLSPEQREEFHGICARLDAEELLAKADLVDISALAVAADNLRMATLAVNADGKYSTVTKQGRPYQCPACHGSGVRPLPKGHREPGDSSSPAPPAGKTTGRPCTICTATNREKIDAALAAGTSFGSVAKRFGTTKSAAFRHKRDHLGRPSPAPRPAIVAAADPTCLGCNGTGVIIPEMRETSEKRPEVTEQRYAIDQVVAISAKMGLDVISRVRVKGKGVGGNGKPSALRELFDRRAAR